MPPTERASSALSRRLSRGSGSMTYSSLDSIRRRSHRTRAWARLDTNERGLFRCAVWLAKARGEITNMRLVAQIMQIALKLLKAAQNRIVKAGQMKAMMMSRSYSGPGGVFSWAPLLRERLCDPLFIRYLGAMEMNT
jgi:hypothetical protein